MKAKITFLLCLCLVMSLCVMGHRQGIKRPTCEFCGLLKAKCQYHGNHPCGQCGQKFSTQSQMAAHKAKAHPAPTFNCNQCGQKFNTQAQLNAHKVKVHPTPPAPTFNCNQCGQKFNTQALLNAHKAKAHAPSVRVSYDASSNSIVFGNNRYKMVYVSGGSFNMGATSEQGSDAYSDEKPVHRVTLSDYYIGQTEVTQALWQAVMGTNPSKWKGDNLPVGNVSWNDCQTFIEKLNVKTGRTFRLPTEAEWEFAARGGNNSRDYKYCGSNYLDNVAWNEDNSNNKTHIVATKQANELGIYDMSGNVWEWCQDWKGGYSSSAQTNPTGPNSGSYRVLRGGGWLSNARSCRVSYRDLSTPGDRYNCLGLRVVLVP